MTSLTGPALARQRRAYDQPPAAAGALYLINQRAELARHMDGLRYMVDVGRLTIDQATLMAWRSRNQVALKWLADVFPGHRFWMEQIGDRTRFIARAIVAEAHPYTVVTESVDELPAAMGADFVDLPDFLPRERHWLPVRPGADKLRDEVRELRPDQAQQALMFLTGYAPAAVRRALLAIATPLSTMGTLP